MLKRVMVSCAAVMMCLAVGVMFAGCSVEGKTFKFSSLEVEWAADYTPTSSDYFGVMMVKAIMDGVKITFKAGGVVEIYVKTGFGDEDFETTSATYTQDGDNITITLPEAEGEEGDMSGTIEELTGGTIKVKGKELIITSTAEHGVMTMKFRR